MRHLLIQLLIIPATFFFTNLSAQSCEGGTTYSWDDDISVILSPCSGCHGGTSGLFLNSYAGIANGGNQCGSDNLLTGNTLITIITSSNTTCSNGTINNSMNSNCGGCIDNGELSAIAAWIADGAPEACAILPVIYTEIAGIQKESYISLKWGTASEINSDRFEIYFSTDLDRYELLGTIKAKGNSTSINEYTFDHTTPVSGHNYYRINQIDFDGTEHVSKLISVRFTGDQENNFVRIYPNPTASESYVVSDYAMNKDMQIHLVDLLGNVVSNKLIPKESGERMFKIDSGNLRSGTYLISVVVEGKVIFTQRLIKTE